MHTRCFDQCIQVLDETINRLIRAIEIPPFSLVERSSGKDRKRPRDQLERLSKIVPRSG